ncbi:hypothetical protein ACFYO1_01785 [Nocardia sp. NPDC006044]|uniref:hypothetical protein n=1 Tax=Nocardia sp. NPDC006044 TaxID=3364306 RepID=UPI00368F1A83
MALALWVANRRLGLNAAELGLRNRLPTGAQFLGAIGISYLALWLGLTVMGSFPQWITDDQVPGHSSPSAAVLYSVRAGVVEEAVILALPMAIMARLRFPCGRSCWY